MSDPAREMTKNTSLVKTGLEYIHFFVECVVREAASVNPSKFLCY